MGPPAPRDLQIGLRDAFVFKAAVFQQSARGGVFGQAGGFDPAEFLTGKRMMHHRHNGLAHITLTYKRLSGPIAQRSSL